MPNIQTPRRDCRIARLIRAVARNTDGVRGQIRASFPDGPTHEA